MAPLLQLPASLQPTRSISRLSSKLTARQATTTIVATDPNSGGTNLDGGAIAGIVIGSIAGFLLLLWLIRSWINLSHPEIWGKTFGGSRETLPATSSNTVYEEVYVPRHSHSHGHRRSRSRSRHSYHHGHHKTSPRREVVQVRSSRPVYVEQRGSSPIPPRPVYSARDSRRVSRSDRHRRYY